MCVSRLKYKFLLSRYRYVISRKTSGHLDYLMLFSYSMNIWRYFIIALQSAIKYWLVRSFHNRLYQYFHYQLSLIHVKRRKNITIWIEINYPKMIKQIFILQYHLWIIIFWHSANIRNTWTPSFKWHKNWILEIIPSSRFILSKAILDLFASSMNWPSVGVHPGSIIDR